ncbi:hypothetical protein B7G68_14955 [Caulobacter segnis]|uniref:Uncharacterized protein n=1 Tax=Caulobacter segnis TaxID=88688 RepID=A0ABN5IVD3_9CAUL|nr:hypothetical protein B7G68_14955 [Caulobacter segnis]
MRCKDGSRRWGRGFKALIGQRRRPPPDHASRGRPPPEGAEGSALLPPPGEERVSAEGASTSVRGAVSSA